jgi:hypothetical protein
MVDSRRPFASYSIEDLETVFSAPHRDVAILTLLVQELSVRKLPRARRLLVRAAKKLSDFDSQAGGDGAPSTFVDDAPPQEEASCDAIEYESVRPTVNDDPVNAANPRGERRDDTIDRDRPPDDRKRPECLTRVRPLGTLGLPPPWVRLLDANRELASGIWTVG